MKFTLTGVEPFLPPLTPTVTWWIAFSGGLDSCVLLHALAALKLPVQLHALHVNHQLSANANSWQEHCAAMCAGLGMAFTAVSVQVVNSGRGIEDAARHARYGVFEQHLGAGDYLFTAHHADDQAETLLLRLMRGAGPQGLAAMAGSRSLAQGTLYRPLLNFTRSALEVYANDHKLCWVNDESNGDNHYNRNYLRNQVMPLLRERWPSFAQKWQQTAELCAANEALIIEIATQDMALATVKPEPAGASLVLAYVTSLSLTRRHNLLRAWLRGQGMCIPEQQHLLQIEQQIIHGRQDAETQVNWGDVSLRVYRDRLYVLSLQGLIRLRASYASAELQFSQKSLEGQPLLKPNLPNLHIRQRHGGERCRPAGRAHSQTLKRLLQEYAVVPWLRDSLPLVYSHDDLVAVSDLWICEGYLAEEGGYSVVCPSSDLPCCIKERNTLYKA